MHSSILTCFFAIGALALPSSDKWPSWGSWGPPQPGAYAGAKVLYVMTNDVGGNSVVAMSIASDGSLAAGPSCPSGGKGSSYARSSDGKPEFPDSLSAQDALIQAGDYLFAVNAGSNSVSMFKISDSDPTSIKLLGQPQSSKGEFPTTLAASTSLNMICVGNTGRVSGVACATFSENGLSSFDNLRPLNSGENTTPPTGPTPGISELLFSSSDSKLLVMVKGNGTEFTGYAAEYAVSGGTVAQSGSMTTPPGSKALFGSATIPGSPNKILTSDAGFGALILNIDNLAAQPIATITVAGQIASCWAQISTLTGTGFITDAGADRLVEINLETGAIVNTYDSPTPFAGMTDFRIDGTYLWALSGSNGSYPSSITTFSIGGGGIKYESVFAIPGAGVNTQGLAIY